MNPLSSKEIKEIVVHLENTLKRTIYFGGVIGSHVLGLNDEKSDIDMNFYCSNNDIEQFIGETFYRELDFTTTDGKEVHIVVKCLNSLKNLNKVPYNLIECLSNTIYFRNDTKGNLLERFFKIFLSDNINQLKFILNCFFIGKKSFGRMSSDKKGSKVSFQEGNVNYKDLSKAYLYKSLIEQDIVIESFSKNDIPKEIRKTYKEIRNGYYEDSLLSEIRVFYKEFEINKIKEKIKNTNSGEYLETLAVIVGRTN